MKFFIALAMLVVLAAGQETYTPENDDLDIDALVSNPESLKAWFNCFVDQGPCDKVQTTFKADLPEAIQQACAKCTSAQKVIMKKFLAALKEKSPGDYEVFRQKFDLENKYFGPLDKAIA
ncbi:ejaculatory bulb-specific protein 3-like [Cydia pomonella]|uniref:ejaculatory bulb-specific protein 3-like n=1 Tax=Cydia pomonella TaxID=82600 RepID=UPI002ADE60BE|nr:ejaculatory bulb-specific protein 3-like [Cydia pomonella]